MSTRKGVRNRKANFAETVPDTNGTVENNIVFLRGFFEQLGFEYVSGLEHEFVSVSPPLEDARLVSVHQNHCRQAG